MGETIKVDQLIVYFLYKFQGTIQFQAFPIKFITKFRISKELLGEMRGLKMSWVPLILLLSLTINNLSEASHRHKLFCCCCWNCVL